MLTEIQISANLHDLKQKIDQIESELQKSGDSPEQLPELIDSANLLRKNEFLVHSDQKKDRTYFCLFYLYKIYGVHIDFPI